MAIITEIRLDWSEMDLFGHINNVMYAKYVQSARVRLTEHIGLMKMLKDINVGFMLASSALQYKKPLFYPGNITIETSVDFIKTTSFGLQHHILDASGVLCCIANDVLVLYDFTAGVKVPIPESILNPITAIKAS